MVDSELTPLIEKIVCVQYRDTASVIVVDERNHLPTTKSAAAHPMNVVGS
jgi:hypothetical protein